MDSGAFARDLGLEVGALSAVAEATAARELLLGGGETVLGGLERFLALASEAL